MSVLDFLDYQFMQFALLAASIVGLTAPLVGIFLVQRRLALLGDGIGHIALTGIGIAVLTGQAPIWGALVAALCGAILVEYLRAKSKIAGDTALSIIFYGGIAGGVLLTSIRTGSAGSTLSSYLFGSLTTVSQSDLIAVVLLGLGIAFTVAMFGRQLLAVSVDPEHAHVQGLRLNFLSGLIATLSAVTVTVGMRAVGLLLVSAIMIIPVVSAQQFAKSFRQTAIAGSIIGWVSAIIGLVFSYYIDVPPGSSIVLTALGMFTIIAILVFILNLIQRKKVTDGFA
ncbi:MAG: metal ABC transporter permease [Actinobacteria bacterium]|nr:metal ABC transporter permease [Actinomycetota bacterium]